AAGWPSGEFDQSRARMSAPILPPPSRNARGAGEPAAFIGHLSTAAGRGPPAARRRSLGAEACLARSVLLESLAVARFCSFPPRVGIKATPSRVFAQPRARNHPPFGAGFGVPRRSTCRCPAPSWIPGRRIAGASLVDLGDGRSGVF